jgi:hypothetical protein
VLQGDAREGDGEVSETFTIDSGAEGVEITATINLNAGYQHVDDEGNGRGPVSIQDAIVHEAARLALKRGDWDSTDAEGRRHLRERIAAIRDEEIRALITPMIREAVAGPVQKTNEYGEPRGEPVSMTAVIMDEVRKALTIQPNSTYRNERSALTNVMREHIDTVITRELKAEVDAAKAKVVKAIQDQGAKFLAETVASMTVGKSS